MKKRKDSRRLPEVVEVWLFRVLLIGAGGAVAWLMGKIWGEI